MMARFPAGTLLLNTKKNAHNFMCCLLQSLLLALFLQKPILLPLRLYQDVAIFAWKTYLALIGGIFSHVTQVLLKKGLIAKPQQRDWGMKYPFTFRGFYSQSMLA